MKTINIKGKEYVPVVERVKEFHKLNPLGQITTEVLLNLENNNRVIVKATVKIPTVAKITTENEENDTLQKKIDLAHRVFTGHSQAVYGEGRMGDVALEVAETSAIGRALGFASIGLIDGIASADEMRKVKKVGDDVDDDLGF